MDKILTGTIFGKETHKVDNETDFNLKIISTNYFKAVLIIQLIQSFRISFKL